MEGIVRNACHNSSKNNFNFPCQLGKLNELLNQGAVSRERSVGEV